jgi:hypothetical protein
MLMKTCLEIHTENTDLRLLITPPLQQRNPNQKQNQKQNHPRKKELHQNLQKRHPNRRRG